MLLFLTMHLSHAVRPGDLPSEILLGVERMRERVVLPLLVPFRKPLVCGQNKKHQLRLLHRLPRTKRPTGAERVVCAVELLAGREFLALCIDALVVVDVAETLGWS